MAARISVVINTLNEERNLPAALRSVAPWADEIVVVDMHSDDRTVEIAREFGASVYTHARTDVVEAARAFAIAQAAGEWILLLDADEVVLEPLSRALREVADGNTADVVMVPRANYLLGARLEHTGWGGYQDRIPRFFKPGAMIPTETIHGYGLDPSARVHDLPPGGDRELLHFNYLDVSQFLEKLNRYTSVEAAQAYERGERYSAGEMIRRASREFAARYWRHKGHRDGWRGLGLSLLMAGYRIATQLKLAELEKVGGRDRARAFYEAEAERGLAGYGGADAPKAGRAG